MESRFSARLGRSTATNQGRSRFTTGTGTHSEMDFHPPGVPIAVLAASGHILMALDKLSRWRPVGGPQQVTSELRSSWTAFSGESTKTAHAGSNWASVAGGSPERKGRDLCVQSAKVRPVEGAFTGFFTGRGIRTFLCVRSV